MPKPTKHHPRVGQVTAMYMLPVDTSASQARRAQLVATWWRESEVLERFGIDANALTLWRHRRRVLAVWHAPEHQYFYPPNQFDAAGPRREMSAVLGYLNDERISGSGWSEVEWLLTPHVLLDGEAPMDMLVHDPSRVLCALHEEFLDGPEIW
jgi:hypothetical protein